MSYSEQFTENFITPSNVGEFAGANVVAEEVNPVCGDNLKLYLRFEDGVIRRAGFLAYGCPATIACGSALTKLITDLTLSEAAALDRASIIEAVGGLPSRKRHAAALAIETLRKALQDAAATNLPQ